MALISGVRPKRSIDQIIIGSVFSVPVVKKVTTTSSNDRVKEISAAATIAGAQQGQRDLAERP